MCASGADCPPDGETFVTAQILHDHDITRRQRRDQHLLDPSQEALANDRPVEHQWRINTVMAQGGEEGQRLPVTVRAVGSIVGNVRYFLTAAAAVMFMAPEKSRWHCERATALSWEEGAGRRRSPLGC
jgi:hypothetical protein